MNAIATPVHQSLVPELIANLKTIVGDSHVLTEANDTVRFRQGFRFGKGSAVAVVCPGSLLEQWRVVKACVAADMIVIMQAANTGLTGGSTPDGGYDREVVIVSTLRMRTVQVIEQGRQVICFPGSTLDQLEKVLKPLGREPHSVIGSSCIGASVFGGVCNNSGGSLIRRGPAYTEMSLYAQLDAEGQLHLVNHLGVNLGDTPEQILGNLDAGRYSEADIQANAGRGSDHGYAEHVRDVDAATPARFNADKQRLHEASGSAGKLAVFAVRLDTFTAERDTAVFYIGTNHTDDLTRIRRHMLEHFVELPIAGEYMHRDAYDVAAQYGKDTFLMIHHLGTQRLPKMFALKSRVDNFLGRFTWLRSHLSDRVLQRVARCFPDHLPKRMTDYRQRFEHYLMLKVSAASVAPTEAYLSQLLDGRGGDFFRCSAEEGSKAFLHRFAAAGAAVRYRAIHDDAVEDIVALDIALARNDRDWFEKLPESIEQQLILKLYYGHFFCHVFHQDYIVRKGSDCLAVEHEMWALLDNRGAEYPAEHNVGHLYPAKAELKAFYQKLDPCNAFNPGVGKTSKCRHWQSEA
ncbi:D-lactate dehydrogenase [Pseudomonas fluorescens]|uniref:Quinone-dependent D-lactate dehydrogenase n=1 Tax=Pseudomonas fluorescens TaxID=294 RepID=A0A5E7A5K1_PSEFL|nr:D-lactate dehydrogenase [Pseudomonas fluorescens]VVN73509.1 Quinone-dependent D-lactate dehydrogenase [Pseudomonas fluorescens]